jgi:hypothetical protein
VPHIKIRSTQSVLRRRARRAVKWVRKYTISDIAAKTYYWLPDVPGPGVDGEKLGDVGE